MDSSIEGPAILGVNRISGHSVPIIKSGKQSRISHTSHRSPGGSYTVSVYRQGAGAPVVYHRSFLAFQSDLESQPIRLLTTALRACISASPGLHIDLLSLALTDRSSGRG